MKKPPIRHPHSLKVFSALFSWTLDDYPVKSVFPFPSGSLFYREGTISKVTPDARID
jgi:hypothetical protein